MNTQQFHLIADRLISKTNTRKAVFQVIFNGVSAYRAEREFNCVKNTVSRTVDRVISHYDHCIAVASATDK